jgi:hypothetical protein
MLQSSNHRRGTGRNRQAHLTIDAMALKASTRKTRLKRIAEYRNAIDRLTASGAPEEQIDVVRSAMARCQELLQEA